LLIHRRTDESSTGQIDHQASRIEKQLRFRLNAAVGGKD